jgi:hypothetical protein
VILKINLVTVFQFSVVIIYQQFNISMDAWKKVNVPGVKGDIHVSETVSAMDAAS